MPGILKAWPWSPESSADARSPENLKAESLAPGSWPPDLGPLKAPESMATGPLKAWKPRTSGTGSREAREYLCKQKTPERGNFERAFSTAGRMYIIETETH